MRLEIGKQNELLKRCSPSVAGPGDATQGRWRGWCAPVGGQFEWNIAVMPFFHWNYIQKTFSKSWFRGWKEPIIMSWLIIVSLLSCVDSWVTHVWAIDCIQSRIPLRPSPERHWDHRGPPRVTAFCKVIMGCTARCNVSPSSYRRWLWLYCCSCIAFSFNGNFYWNRNLIPFRLILCPLNLSFQN